METIRCSEIFILTRALRLFPNQNINAKPFLGSKQCKFEVLWHHFKNLAKHHTLILENFPIFIRLVLIWMVYFMFFRR